MDRSVAVTDRETIGGGDRGTDERLGVADGGLQPAPFASSAAIADDSEQPVPWVFCVATRGAGSASTPSPRTR